MKKDEPRGGLFSKMVRFVRHPTVDWSELDEPRPKPGAAVAQGREAIKAVLESKRRNDLVRAREFNELRELMRQRRAEQAGAEGRGRESGLLAVEALVQGGQKGATMEKIAQIEAQMSRHWLSRGAGEEAPALHIAAAAVPSRHDGGITVPAHLQATQPMSIPGGDLSAASTIPLNMLEGDFAGLHAEPAPAPAFVTFAALEEAAVRFANGDDAAVERGLRAALAQEAGSTVGRLAWESLLDFFVATGQAAAFEQLAGEFADLYGVQPPEWPSMPAAQGVAPPTWTWTCPPVLDTASVQSLGAALASTGEVKWLDWSALVSADLAAAQALLELVEHWLAQEVEFRFAGAGVLRRRLKASTPSGRRENDHLWWRLRLALLRLMQRVEEFDLAALDFCVTYGELPPDWVAPRSRYRPDAEPPPSVTLPVPVEPEAPVAVEPIRLLATQLGGLDVLEWPAMSSDSTTMVTLPAALAEQAAAVPQLRGALCGDIAPALQLLQAALDKQPRGQSFAIDCRALARVDFPAAGSLLQWLLGAVAQGVQPELAGVNRLVAAFFHVVGLDEAAPVRLREY